MSITKPQSAFQYYLKRWKELSDKEKTPFVLMSQRDKNRYDDEILKKDLEEEGKVRELQLYLRAYAGGYGAVGLDNGEHHMKQ